MTKRLQAVLDKIVIRIMSDDRMTEGGIVIPDNVIQLPQLTGEVVSVGEDVNCVCEGDIIYCHRNAGMDILVNNNRMKILKDQEIYAIVTDEIDGVFSDELTADLELDH